MDISNPVTLKAIYDMLHDGDDEILTMMQMHCEQQQAAVVSSVLLGQSSSPSSSPERTRKLILEEIVIPFSTMIDKGLLRAQNENLYDQFVVPLYTSWKESTNSQRRQILSDQFRGRLRLGLPALDHVMQQLEQDPVMAPTGQKGRPPIPALKKFTLFLERVAHPSKSYPELEWLFNVSAGSVSNCSKNSIEAILKAFPDGIHFPCTEEEMKRTADRFEEKYDFPCVIGCIDGTHCSIEWPFGSRDSAFVDRDGSKSVVFQIVCNSDLMVTHVFGAIAGRAHDSRLFNLSDLSTFMHNNVPVEYHLVGDSGYALRVYMMIPHTHRQAPSGDQRLAAMQMLFTEKLCHMRQCVERCIGLLKGRFRILRGTIPIRKLQQISDIFHVCSILHNICRRCDYSDIEFEEDLLEDLRLNPGVAVELPPQQVASDGADDRAAIIGGMEKRNALAEYFAAK